MTWSLSASWAAYHSLLALKEFWYNDGDPDVDEEVENKEEEDDEEEEEEEEHGLIAEVNPIGVAGNIRFLLRFENRFISPIIISENPLEFKFSIADWLTCLDIKNCRVWITLDIAASSSNELTAPAPPTSTDFK